MCTFNGSRFLDAQLRSIRDQERLPYELVVCDDGSSDGSDDLARDFARQAPFPVHVIRNSHNLGSTKNFEKAISLCEGKVVALADQDDIWSPNKLARIEKAVLAPKPPVAVFSDADLIDDESRATGRRLWPSFLFRRSEQVRFAHGKAVNILVKHPVVTGASMAFRKEFFPLLSPFPENQIHDCWMAFLLAACGDLLPISDPLMQYRQHRAQQIGPGHATLLERVSNVPETGPAFYSQLIEPFCQVAERLRLHRSEMPGAEVALHQIEKKISHLELRARLSRAVIARIPKVLREMANGGYWHYSLGWQSVAKDIVGYKRQYWHESE